ncbi:MAG: phosphotransferase family protein, partial [Ilumatobacteraceae bacterium]
MAREALDPIALARALAPVYGDGTVADVRRLSGGASRETWAFDLVAAAGGTHPLVLRRDPGGSVIGSNERSTEYALLAAAADAGVRVPRGVHLLEPTDGLGR